MSIITVLKENVTIKPNSDLSGVDVTVKTGSSSSANVSVTSTSDGISITGGAEVGSASISGGAVTVGPNGVSTQGTSISIGIDVKGGRIELDIKPGPPKPHPTDPSAPPIPSAVVTPTITIGPVTIPGPSVTVSTDDILDPEVPGSPLSSGLLGEAYRKIRHRQREIDAAVDEAVNGKTNEAARYTPPRRDPLAIDLDNDGIETLGISASPIVFDHNADGLKTGTGWLTRDDAWLVRDLDGNETIDTGRELFGVDTLITVGNVTRNATTGFEALSNPPNNHHQIFF